jgi:esterase/lipase superfamily enzyme
MTSVPAKQAIAATAMGLALVCSACSGRPSQGVLIPTVESAEGTTRVPILAATTRRRSTTDAGEMFNGERAEGTSYAAIAVSIPPDSARQVGAVQWPQSLPGDPGRNFVTVSADYIDKPAFDAALSAMAKGSGHNKVIVFVHGFNNRFDDAVYRFAQIVHDANVDGVPVLFTWPSLGQVRLGAYTYDKESANYSRDALEQLLDALAANSNVKEISLVAHSMGNWIALEALRGKSIHAGKIGDKVKNVFLVAPDIDVDVFRTQIQRMGTSRPRFLLFISQDDQALGLSQLISGGVPRLGDINPVEEPYRTVLERQQIMVFDLTKLKGNAHSRAFDDITAVMEMIRNRSGEESRVSAHGAIPANQLR